jgi:transposase
VPEDFFAGSIGILMTDLYSAYKCLSTAIKKAWCWVHVRRDFIKLLAVSKFRKWAKKWLIEISKLFVFEHARALLWSAGQNAGSAWDNAQKTLCDHTEFMQNNWRTELRKYLHKEQKTVMQSLKKHWDGLTLFLVDPRIPLDNNKAERLLRLCVIQRKNSYGNGVEWAGHLSAKFFTVFQTWLINGLDPQALLLDYFNQCSLHPGKPPPSVVNFLSWKMSQERKDDFCLPLSYKRPA